MTCVDACSPARSVQRAACQGVSPRKKKFLPLHGLMFERRQIVAARQGPLRSAPQRVRLSSSSSSASVARAPPGRSRRRIGRSSMAITNRAARGDIHSASYTPDVVGPGSYLKVDRKQTIHGFAPFSSTVERPGPLVSSAPTPGPGAYVTALENTCGRTVFAPNGVAPGAGAAFASRVARPPQPGRVGFGHARRR